MFAQPITTVESKAKSGQMLIWSSITVFLIILAGIVIWNLKTPDPRRVMRFDYHLPEDLQFNWNQYGEVPLAVSFDGSRFVYGTTKGLNLGRGAGGMRDSTA